jgi:putative peptide zinc metalloprotease protein
MGESLLSASWYRVARLRPRIPNHAKFHRTCHRGRTWYLLQDRSTGRCHRVSETGHYLAALMDGRRTTHEIWEAACTRFGDDAPTQDDTIALLGVLDAANVLRCDVSPNTAELLRRIQRREDSEWWRRFTNPISIRVPLFDPDPFLDRTLHLVRPLFSPVVAFVCLAVGALAVVLAAAHASEISAEAGKLFQMPLAWLLMALLYPILKAIHELGHAFAAKACGAPVKEMGILFLVFVPLPYVDASGVAVLSDRWKRAGVGAAGIAVEGMLASAALFVWLAVGPGLVSSMALIVMLVGGASTLLFNGNPLLRYDGYYVLSDALDLPNLYDRSRQYVSYLIHSRVLGLSSERRPLTEVGEEKWLLGYGIASWLYRVFILLAISLFLAGRFFIVGVLLAVFALVAQLAVPAAKQVGFLLASPRLAGRRATPVARAAAALLLLATLVLVLPLPLSTRAQGVVWPDEHAQVRASEEGFVLRVLVAPGARVEQNAPLIETHDPTLRAERRILEARLDELHAQVLADRYEDRARAAITREALDAATASYRRIQERAAEGVLRAPSSGRFVLASGVDLTGRRVEPGELLGYVLSERLDTVRVVVPQHDAALVRAKTQSVRIRSASRIEDVHDAVLAEVPAAVGELPSRSLGTEGGGPFAVDPDDPSGLRVAESVFQLDLRVPPEALAGAIGERVHVRFDHGAEPIAWRTLRALRRLLIRSLDV